MTDDKIPQPLFVNASNKSNDFSKDFLSFVQVYKILANHKMSQTSSSTST